MKTAENPMDVMYAIGREAKGFAFILAGSVNHLLLLEICFSPFTESIASGALWSCFEPIYDMSMMAAVSYRRQNSVRTPAPLWRLLKDDQKRYVLMITEFLRINGQPYLLIIDHGVGKPGRVWRWNGKMLVRVGRAILRRVNESYSGGNDGASALAFCFTWRENPVEVTRQAPGLAGRFLNQSGLVLRR